MQSSLYRLTYVSTATFNQNPKGGIESEVARILLQSRRNNPKSGLGGVLHYGNGYFFQCLEGPERQVKAVYQKIGQDSRHKDAQILTQGPIDARLFIDWSMKYLALEEDLNRLLASWGQKEFNPYDMNEEMIDQLLLACVNGVDPVKELGTEVEGSEEKPLTRWWRRMFKQEGR